MALPYCLTLGDVDADGDLDVIIGNNDAILVLLNDGKRQLQLAERRLTREFGYHTNDIVSADFDNDGDLDIFACNRTFPNRI
ncbi:MAG: FG-GAP repeat domain-containing protein [Planctomycetales bacterium]